jgi:hypothetical protein
MKWRSAASIRFTAKMLSKEFSMPFVTVELPRGQYRCRAPLPMDLFPQEIQPSPRMNRFQGLPPII